MTFAEATRLRIGQSVYWTDPDAGICSQRLTIRSIRFEQENQAVYIEDETEGEISCLASNLSLSNGRANIHA